MTHRANGSSSTLDPLRANVGETDNSIVECAAIEREFPGEGGRLRLYSEHRGEILQGVAGTIEHCIVCLCMSVVEKKIFFK